MGTDYSTQFITGKNVCANGFNTLGHVYIDRIVKANPIYDSSGQGGADRPTGNVDFEGYIMAWGRQPPTDIYPNKMFDMKFTLIGGTGASVGTGGAFVMCTGLDVIVPTNDPKEENAVFYMLHFGAAGTDLTYGGAVIAAPTTLTKYPVQGLTMAIGGNPVDGVEHMQFSIHQQRGQAEPNSSTNGVCLRPVANLDYSFMYRIDVNAMSLLPTLNSIVAPIVMRTDGTNGWTASYGRVMQHKGIFDHANSRLLAVDVTLSKCTSGTDVGSVLMPDGTKIWPQT